MYYHLDDTEFKVTTHTHTHTYHKIEEEIRKKTRMSMVSLNLDSFHSENHGCRDVAPIKQKPVSHTDPK